MASSTKCDKRLMEAIHAMDSGELDPTLPHEDPRLVTYQKIRSIFDELCPDEECAAEQNEKYPEEIGKIEIVEVLGSGTFGTVYLGEHPELGRVAVKVLKSVWLSSDKDRRRFQDEARLAAKAGKHPSIVTLHWYEDTDDKPYLVFAYIEGTTLAKQMESRKLRQPFKSEEAAKIIARVADAIAFAHQNGIYHNDLKPANILIDKDGNPHIADFGLAISDASQRQMEILLAGTPDYMSPEQLRKERRDGRSDIWALGVILYEMVTGIRPFWQRSVKELVDDINTIDPKPPRQINSKISPKLVKIILKCLEKEPRNRYETATDLSAELDKVANPTRWKPVCLLAAVVLVSVVCGLLFMIVLNPSGNSVIVAAEKGRGGVWQPLKNGEKVKIDYAVRFTVDSDVNSYLYVWHVDPDGTINWLFPKNEKTDISRGANPITKNTKEHLFPRDGNFEGGYTLPEPAGEEAIRFVLIHTPPESLLQWLQKNAGKKTRGLGKGPKGPPIPEEAHSEAISFTTESK